MIPLEIARRGKAAIEIYKRVLKKGKGKLPRCNLLILGEEHVGKTSLYRLLVNKGFDPNQKSTRGIDDNEVDIVDERSVAMGVEWEEKPKENQEDQISKTFVEGVSETLHDELPPEKTEEDSVQQETVLSDKELRENLERIKRELKTIPDDKLNVEGLVPSQLPAADVDKPPTQKPTPPPQTSTKKPQERLHSQPLSQKPTSHKKEDQDETKPLNPPQREVRNPPTATPTKESIPVHTPEPLPKPKHEVDVPKISRREGQGITDRLKARKKRPKSEPKEPLQLELKALDFAGQKQYRPMHHCFITRRAMYLVVFNLQKMIQHIELEEANPSHNLTSTESSPIEQLRYWLYSIHAHIFLPEDFESIRRVCLVGTHRSPPKEKGKHITDEELRKIDERLYSEFSEDDRCTNFIHYMGESRSKLIFAAVENSIDGKEIADRRESGAVALQKELKEVSNQLDFLDEDHPLIWLRFEQRLVRHRQSLMKMKLPLFVSVEEVKKLAESQGIDEDEILSLH